MYKVSLSPYLFHHCQKLAKQHYDIMLVNSGSVAFSISFQHFLFGQDTVVSVTKENGSALFKSQTILYITPGSFVCEKEKGEVGVSFRENPHKDA